MRISRTGLIAFKDYNLTYNTLVGAVTTDIFNTENSPPDHYINSRSPAHRPGRLESKYLYGDYEYIRDAQQPPQHQVGRFRTAGLGEYEKVLLSCLAWGKYDTYVLVGEMGSGKTTTAKYMADFLKTPRATLCGSCTSCEPVIIYIDFNAFTSAAILRQFRARLRASFKAHLRHIFRTSAHLMDAFVKFVALDVNRGAYAYFDDFLELEVENEPSWSRLTHLQKTRRLFAFIESSRFGDDEVQFELLMLLTAFIQREHRPDPACFLVVLDNLDSVDPRSQFELLIQILRYNQTAKVRTLVPLRRSTFEQLPNEAALSFGIISHLGPQVGEVVKGRLDSVLRNWDTLEQIKALEARFSTALFARLGYLATDLRAHNSGSEKVLWLAGASLRQGLFLFERTVINNAWPYDKHPLNRAEILRFAIQGTDHDFDNQNRFVANIFADVETYNLSLLSVRILQFVEVFGESGDSRRTRNLFSLFGELSQTWRPEKICRTLNYLLRQKRPLLWVDGKTSYTSVKHAVDCDDILYMTEAGDNYLRRLLFDVQYLQEMLLALEWEENSGLPASVNYGSMDERFDLLRRFLELIMRQDQEETHRFQSLKTRNPFIKDVAVRYISQQMVLRTAATILNIYRSLHHKTAEIASSARSWLSTVLTAANLQEAPGQRVNQLVRGFEGFIAEWESRR